MKKTLLLLMSIALVLSFSLVSCKKQETPQKKEAPAAGYDEKKAPETPGYGEEIAPEAGGYDEKKAPGY